MARRGSVLCVLRARRLKATTVRCCLSKKNCEPLLVPVAPFLFRLRGFLGQSSCCNSVPMRSLASSDARNSYAPVGGAAPASGPRRDNGGRALEALVAAFPPPLPYPVDWRLFQPDQSLLPMLWLPRVAAEPCWPPHEAQTPEESMAARITRHSRGAKPGRLFEPNA